MGIDAVRVSRNHVVESMVGGAPLPGDGFDIGDDGRAASLKDADAGQAFGWRCRHGA